MGQSSDTLTLGSQLGFPWVFNQTMAATAQTMCKAIGTRFGLTLTIPIVVGSTTANLVASENAESTVMPVAASDSCVITETPLGTSYVAPGEQEWILAHEVFHCIARQIQGSIGNGAAFKLTPKWVGEGLPEWVASQVAKPPVGFGSRLADWFKKDYLPFPQTTLDMRSEGYDAVGFWGHLEDSGVDLTGARLNAVLEAQPTGTEAMFAAAVAGNEKNVLDSWGASFLRNAAYGSQWTIQHPFQAPQADHATWQLIPSRGGKVIVKPYSAGLVQVRAPATKPIVHIELHGFGRLGDMSLNTTNLADSWFCQKTGSCSSCSPGSQPPPTLHLDPEAYLGLGAAENETTAKVTFMSLAQYCQEKAKPAAVSAPIPASVPQAKPVTCKTLFRISDFPGASGVTLSFEGLDSSSCIFAGGNEQNTVLTYDQVSYVSALNVAAARSVFAGDIAADGDDPTAIPPPTPLSNVGDQAASSWKCGAIACGGAAVVRVGKVVVNVTVLEGGETGVIRPATLITGVVSKL